MDQTQVEYLENEDKTHSAKPKAKSATKVNIDEREQESKQILADMGI